MLYNIEQKKIVKQITCLKCKYYDKKINRCNGGIGKLCFLYDQKTGTIIDSVTKLPLKLKQED